MAINKLSRYKINELKKQIESNSPYAVNNFWTSIQKQSTPLIEEINGDMNNVLVTFIYKEMKPIENILIFGSFPGYSFS